MSLPINPITPIREPNKGKMFPKDIEEIELSKVGDSDIDKLIDVINVLGGELVSKSLKKGGSVDQLLDQLAKEVKIFDNVLDNFDPKGVLEEQAKKMQLEEIPQMSPQKDDVLEGPPIPEEDGYENPSMSYEDAKDEELDSAKKLSDEEEYPEEDIEDAREGQSIFQKIGYVVHDISRNVMDNVRDKKDRLIDSIDKMTEGDENRGGFVEGLKGFIKNTLHKSRSEPDDLDKVSANDIQGEIDDLVDSVDSLNKNNIGIFRRVGNLVRSASDSVIGLIKHEEDMSEPLERLNILDYIEPEKGELSKGKPDLGEVEQVANLNMDVRDQEVDNREETKNIEIDDARELANDTRELASDTRELEERYIDKLQKESSEKKERTKVDRIKAIRKAKGSADKIVENMVPIRVGIQGNYSYVPMSQEEKECQWRNSSFGKCATEIKRVYRERVALELCKLFLLKDEEAKDENIDSINALYIEEELSYVLQAKIRGEKEFKSYIIPEKNWSKFRFNDPLYLEKIPMKQSLYIAEGDLNKQSNVLDYYDIGLKNILTVLRNVEEKREGFLSLSKRAILHGRELSEAEREDYEDIKYMVRRMSGNGKRRIDNMEKVINSKC